MVISEKFRGINIFFTAFLIFAIANNKNVMAESKNTSLDVLLQNILKDVINIQDCDRQKYKGVFKHVFESIIEKMRLEDSFYQKYAKQTQFAGSNYDGIKIGKPDEFDMDIVIKLPINYDEIILENMSPGLVKVKIEKAFDNLPKQPNWELCHKVTLGWRDESKYFLRNKFQDWIQSLVHKGINRLNKNDAGDPCIMYEEVEYKITYSKAGPAFTINTKNADQNFVLDVDFVPVIQFKLDKLPPGYEKLKQKNGGKENWFIVPKPVKNPTSKEQQNQSWRMAFHDQERELLKDNNNLKPTIRLMKKLRDVLKMKDIASYYIKTLFLWEVEQQKSDFWQQKLSILYPHMVKRLYNAVSNNKIPYYWNQKLNLLGFLNPNVLKNYEQRLKNVVNNMESKDNVEIMRSILTEVEFNALNIKVTDFKSNATPAGYVPLGCGTDETDSKDPGDQIVQSTDVMERIEVMLKDLENRQKYFEIKFLESLENNMKKLNSRLDQLEQNKCSCKL